MIKIIRKTDVFETDNMAMLYCQAKYGIDWYYLDMGASDWNYMRGFGHKTPNGGEYFSQYQIKDGVDRIEVYEVHPGFELVEVVKFKYMAEFMQPGVERRYANTTI